MKLPVLFEYLLREDTFGSPRQFIAHNPLTRLILNYVDSVAEVEQAVEEQDLEALINVIKTYIQFIPSSELRSEAGIVSKADLQKKLEPAVKGAAEALLTGIDLNESSNLNKRDGKMKVTKVQLQEMIRKLAKQVIKEMSGDMPAMGGGPKELGPAVTRKLYKERLFKKTVELGQLYTSDEEDPEGLSPTYYASLLPQAVEALLKRGTQTAPAGWYIVEHRIWSSIPKYIGPFKSPVECRKYAEKNFGPLNEPGQSTPSGGPSGTPFDPV